MIANSYNDRMRGHMTRTARITAISFLALLLAACSSSKRGSVGMAFSTRALEHAPTLPEGMTAAPEEEEDEVNEEEKKEAIAAAEPEKQAENEKVEKKSSSRSKKATATHRKSPSREQQLAAEALLRRQMEEEAAAAAASTQDIFVPGMNARGLRLGRFAAPEESGTMQESGAPAPNAVDRYGLRSPSMSGKLPMDLDGRINKKSR